MFLVVDEGVWRDVEEVNVGDVVRGFSEWAFVWGDVDPHDCGLGAGEPDGGQVERVFITNVKGTFLGMSESEEASKRR